jgi:hypothetical protein
MAIHLHVGDISLSLTLLWEITQPYPWCSAFYVCWYKCILFHVGSFSRRPPATRDAVYFAPVPSYRSLHPALYNGMSNFRTCRFQWLEPINLTRHTVFSQVIVPVLVDEIWCAYMFDIQSSKVHVLDPVHCPERAQLHDFFKTKFLQSLAGCFEAFYDNWYMSRLDDWQFHYPDLSVNNIARYELYLPFNITTTYIKTPLVCFYAPAPSYRSHMFFCILYQEWFRHLHASHGSTLQWNWTWNHMWSGN